MPQRPLPRPSGRGACPGDRQHARKPHPHQAILIATDRRENRRGRERARAVSLRAASDWPLGWYLRFCFSSRLLHKVAPAKALHARRDGFLERLSGATSRAGRGAWWKAWRFSEPSLSTDAASSVGDCATATARRSKCVTASGPGASACDTRNVGSEGGELAASGTVGLGAAAVDLYWLPLGAGGHFVRLNGRVYEALAARVERRRACDLYHSALQVEVAEGSFVIEQTPASELSAKQPGVVAEGAVGSRWAGRFRIFRYEIRLWRGGHIPDVAEAVDSPRRLTHD